ncbi:MAG: TonB-dependent receptor, partial [Vicinamibacterales bacterium]
DPQSLGINTGPLDPEDLGVPGVTTPFGHIGGVGGYPITTKPTTTTQLSMALTQTRGQHTLKTGAAWDYAYNRSVRNQARTTLTANGSTSRDVDALVGLLLARFENAARSFGQTERHMSQSSIGVFINDDWRVTSRMTLSGGLRYEVFSPVSEKDNLATNFFPDKGLVQVGNGIDKLYNADTNNFGPRAGLAWDVMGDAKTSVRMGYALTYDSAQIGVVHPGLFSTPTLGVFRVSLAQSPRVAPDNPLATCVNPNNSAAGGDYICLQPGVPVFGSSPTGAPPFNIFAMPADFQLGRYHYFHTTVQRQIGNNNSVTVSYVGSRGQGLVWRKETNAPPLGSPTTSPDLLRPYRSAFPEYRSIVEYTNDGQSWYDSMQLSFRQNAWHGVNTQYSYTWSNCTDYNSGNRDAANAQAANPYNPAANKGPCDFDIRHNFSAGGSYEIPGARLGGGPLQVGAAFSALSGRPFTPGQGTTDLSGQATGVMRANCLAEPIYNYDLDYLFPNPTTSRSAITNAAQAFANPAAGTLGTCGRNSGRRPGFSALDLNILKEFKLRGNARIQARWEIFNLTNRVNLGTFLSTSTRSGVFGQIGSTPDVDRGNAVIGSGGPRAMQWAVKVLF